MEYGILGPHRQSLSESSEVVSRMLRLQLSKYEKENTWTSNTWKTHPSFFVRWMCSHGGQRVANQVNGADDLRMVKPGHPQLELFSVTTLHAQQRSTGRPRGH